MELKVSDDNGILGLLNPDDAESNKELKEFDMRSVATYSC